MEPVDINIDRPQPRPSTSIQSTSLEPFGYTSFPRTQVAATDSLSGIVGTSIVTSFVGVSRGLDGNPITTTSLPIMNTGVMVPMSTSLMGNLRGPSMLLSQVFQELHARGFFPRLPGSSSSSGVGGIGGSSSAVGVV